MEDLRPKLESGLSRSPLLQWRGYAFPIDWGRQFGRKPLDLHLEVGFGDGRYTVRQALENPNAQFVGLEIASASVQRGLKRLKRSGATNVRLLKGNARFALRHLFEPRSIQSVTVNFPDPWPKERHQDNRLLSARFFDLAATRLVEGGKLMLATDHPDYLAFAKEQARQSGRFELYEAEPPAGVFETKYALKWKEQGKPLFYQIFEYSGAPAPAQPHLERDQVMPHALFTGELPAEFEFDKRVVPYGKGHVILHEVARSLGGDHGSERLLVRTTVDEPDLRQQILVVVARRSPEEWIVRLESFGDPIITETVRGAVHAVSDWLLSLPADLKITKRAY